MVNASPIAPSPKMLLGREAVEMLPHDEANFDGASSA